MIRSMTAFTRMAGGGKTEAWTVEIRSLNHRYFEFLFKAPSSLYPFENRVRELVQGKLHRGKISVTITAAASKGDGTELVLDEKVAAFYVKTARRLSKKFELQGMLSTSELLQLPRIFCQEKENGDCEQHWPSLKRVLQKALRSTVAMKEEEGRKLAVDIEQRLENLQKCGVKVEKLSENSAKSVFSKVRERIRELVPDTLIDEDRVLREVAFLAERSDLTEELVRFQSHIALFRKRLQTQNEIGRELDFLCQEINREINTMGSKAQLFEISSEVIFMKKELEKIREQVQNIE